LNEYSGGKASSSLHLARAICRRAERRIVPLLDEGLELPILQYLNRLSSYLFTIARVCAINDGFKETIYKRPKPQDSENQ
jgi:cob(I)alamin adenosyltransferase